MSRTQRILVLMLTVVAAGLMGADEQKKARYYYERGQVREKKKQYEDALADYTRAVTFDPKFVDGWFTRSSLYADRNEFAKAIDDLTKLLEVEPNNYSALYNRALFYEQVREYDKVIAGYSRIVDGKVDYSHLIEDKEAALAHVYHYRGRAYQWYKHDYPKAVADFTKCLELQPRSEMVRYRRADAYHALKEYAKADEDYAAAFKQDPDYPNLLDHWAWQLATCPDSNFRDGRRAVEMATKACNSFLPRLGAHLNTLAAAHAECGSFDEAVKWQETALENLAAREKRLERGMRERLALYRAGKPFREE